MRVISDTEAIRYILQQKLRYTCYLGPAHRLTQGL
jgi:hypothetical protein